MDGYWLLDTEGRVLEVNETACRMTGYTAQELLTMRLADLEALETEELTAARVQKIIADGEDRFESRHRRKDGRIFDVEVSVQFRPSGIGNFICFVRDITGRKRVEQQKEDAVSYVHTLLTASSVGIITYKASGQAISANEAAANLVGTTIENLKGQNFRELDSWKQSGLLKMAELALATDREQIFEDHLVTTFGHEIWVSNRFVPFRFAGEPHLLLLSQDISQRKRAEESVMRLSQWLLRTQSIGKVGGWAVNVKSGEVWVSPEARRIYGLSEEVELSLAQIQSFVLTAYRPKLDLAFRELVEHGKPYEVEFQISRGNDQAIADIHSRAEYDAKETTVLGVIKDVTERKRAEAALRRSESLFSTMFHASPTAMGISRLEDGRFLNVNDAFLRLYGYNREEIIGHTSEELRLWPSADRAELLRVLQQHKRVQLLDIKGRRKNGEHCDILASVELIPVDGEPCIMGILTDVTERKQAQAALARSEAELAAIHDSSPLMMCLVNGDQQVERLNRAMAEFAAVEGLPEFGQRPGDTLGCVNALDDPRGCGFGKACHSCALRLAIRATFETGQSCRQVDSQLFLVRGGLRRELQVWASTSLVQFGGPPRVLLCLEDITQRKQLEAQFLQAQKMESVGQLAGGVAHDFNNILAATMLELSFLQQNPNFDPETRESLKELMTEAQRAANLTRQLLVFSRRSVMEIKVLDLNELVANLLKMLGRLIGEHITLEFHRHDALPAVEADPGMVEQALMNLAVNARDAMPKGGKLIISITPFQADEERVKGHIEARPGRHVCLSVADSGCGMDGATLKRIFEPFFTTKEAGKGTGLGLATVHGIAAQHQGWVEAESELGNGSTFRVFFPATSKAAPESIQTDRAPITRGHETILLVEDEESLRRVVRQVLRQLGYHVLEAANGAAALELWRELKGRIDLLLSDMVMPEGLTGLDLAGKLREEKPDLKVIIVSGYNPEMAGQSRPTTEGIVYLQKPFHLTLLSTTIRACLDKP